jgi:hypothetical protein
MREIKPGALPGQDRPVIRRVSMKTVRFFSVLAIAALSSSAVLAQGKESDLLKKMEGNWGFTMKGMGMELGKGKVTYKMEIGDMWLVSTLESELMGSKFTAKGLDSYDSDKKKFVSVFCHSMSAKPIIMEGTYDKAKKTLTLVGEEPGMDGKPMKTKSITEMPDDDTMIFSMYTGEAKEPMFTIEYKRKK